MAEGNIIGYLIATVISSVITWFLARRKNKAEAMIAEEHATAEYIRNQDSIIATWKKAAEDWMNNAETYRNMMLEYRTTVDRLQLEYNKKIGELTERIGQLEKQLKTANKKINELESEKNGKTA